MENEYRKEVKEIMKEGIEHCKATQHSRYIQIDGKLDSIIEQTTATNGKVSTLEDKVRSLEDTRLETSSIKGFIVKIVVASTSFISIGISVLFFLLS